jgi:thiol-disulfide isomerase/thioredoxin
VSGNTGGRHAGGRPVIIGLAAVLIAAGGGFFAQRVITERNSLQEAPGAGQLATHEPKPEVIPDTAEEPPPKHTIPETLPDIRLPDRTGATKSLEDGKGRPRIINFWATWCGPCREEIPLLKSLRKERTADRLEVIGIAIDERQAVLKYASEIGIDYPVLIGEQDGYEAAERFGVAMVLPFSVFADSRGRIVSLKIGELHADEAAYILDRIRDVDANRVALPDARLDIAGKLREMAVERGRKNAEAG